jgi:1,4-alpha-glucan branching enzyme
MQRLIGDLNRLYAAEPALQYGDLHPEGFEWVIGDDAENSVFGMLRKSADGGSFILAISNMTPVPREGYRVGVPQAGRWSEVLNTDAGVYGGSNLGNVEAWSEEQPAHGQPQSLLLTLPPLATIYLRWQP